MRLSHHRKAAIRRAARWQRHTFAVCIARGHHVQDPKRPLQMSEWHQPMAYRGKVAFVWFRCLDCRQDFQVVLWLAQSKEDQFTSQDALANYLRETVAKARDSVMHEMQNAGHLRHLKRWQKRAAAFPKPFYDDEGDDDDGT